jgi:broad specificity phosphatase PhoE
MNKNRLIAILFLSVVIILLFGYLNWFSPVTTVFLVRHADRDNGHLNHVGLRRADTLAYVVGEAGLSAIYVTEFERTHQTAQPTATAMGLTPIQLPAAETDALVDRIRSEHSGEVVLVVGHSNTIPVLIQTLGIAPAGIPASIAYDDLFVVNVKFLGRATFQHLRYGTHLNQKPATPVQE